MPTRARPSSQRISLLIPAKNEERNLAWVLSRIPLIVDEVILIDGHSTDRTVEVARAMRPDIVVVPEMGPGKGAAVRTGIAAATGEFIVMIDADGSMEPREISKYVEALAEGADVVKGSRFLPGGGTSDMTRLRMVGNRALLGIVNTAFGTRFTELCYGFMAFRRDAMLGLGLTSDGFEIETEIVVRSALHGLTISEVPSFESPRRFGTSHLNTFRDGARVLRTIVARRASWAATATSAELALREPEFPAPALASRAPALATQPVAAATSDDVEAIESLTA
jgi:glycosyltransferase involved in cell wall biosynthesis